MGRPRRVGVTLIEVLVVIGIIGILIAVLLPAIQAAREAARRRACMNHLRQLGIGMLSHHDLHRHFPSGGWGYTWTGDPDRGSDRKQPGGWIYNLLPYIEQTTLRDTGRGSNADEKKGLAAAMAQTPLELFNCPSRREVDLYPYTGDALRNSAMMKQAAKSDYAVNGGDKPCGQMGPLSLQQGDSKSYNWGPVAEATGISFLRSEVAMRDITDGASHTYLIGEKYCRTEGNDQGDDQHMYVGHDADTLRYTTLDRPPLPDGSLDAPRSFGSAHPGGCPFVFVDSSVRIIEYGIDPEIHRRLGNRRDGLPIDEGKL